MIFNVFLGCPSKRRLYCFSGTSSSYLGGFLEDDTRKKGQGCYDGMQRSRGWKGKINGVERRGILATNL
jgi:hypothetical protein